MNTSLSGVLKQARGGDVHPKPQDINQAAGSVETKSIAGVNGGTVPTPQRSAVAESAAGGDEGVEPTPAPVADEPTNGDDGGHILAELRKRERIILQGRKAWQVGATALMEIRNHRLYKAAGFTEFGKYCEEVLKMGKSTINRHIAIAEVYSEVYKAVASTEAKILPTSERQLRPLLSLRQKDHEPSVWGESVGKVWTKVVQDAEILKKPITQKSVLLALQQLHPAQTPKESEPELDLEKRWLKLEALIEHEKEFWPGEHRHDLRVRIVGLLSDWETGTKQPDSHSDHPNSVVNEAPSLTAPETSPAVPNGETADHAAPDEPVNSDAGQQVAESENTAAQYTIDECERLPSRRPLHRLKYGRA